MVPQGCVLDPLLFLIFISDLSDCLMSPAEAKKFVNDTKLYFAHSSGHTAPLPVHCLPAFCDSSSNWQLSIALQKSNIISLGSNVAPDTLYALSRVNLDLLFEILVFIFHLI